MRGRWLSTVMLLAWVRLSSVSSWPARAAAVHVFLLMQKYKVDVYMNGHDHDIQHVKRSDRWAQKCNCFTRVALPVAIEQLPH